MFSLLIDKCCDKDQTYCNYIMRGVTIMITIYNLSPHCSIQKLINTHCHQIVQGKLNILKFLQDLFNYVYGYNYVFMASHEYVIVK